MKIMTFLRFPTRSLGSWGKLGILVVAALAAAVWIESSSWATTLGRIVSIHPDQRVVQRGGVLKVTVMVESFQSGQHHQLVALNIISLDKNTIYDSHKMGTDIGFVIGSRERKTVGPFVVRIPSNARPGRYYVLAGYRQYPWEPLIAFRGTDWAPPQEIIRIR